MMRILFFCILFVSVCFARVGGPDDYGYIFTDQESGISFDWVSESGAETLSLSGDDSFALLNLPFTFRFYGHEYNRVYVSTNGLIAVDSVGASSYRWTHIPSTELPNGFLAPLWADGGFAPGSSLLLYKTVGVFPNRKFVIIFKDQYVPYYSEDYPFTYEVIIEETEFGDNPVVFQYLHVYNPDYWEYAYGNHAAIGIESPDGLVGLEYSYDTTAVDSGSAIRFEVRPPAEHDVAVADIILPPMILVNNPFMVRVKVKNRGMSIEPDIPVMLDIFDSLSVRLYHGEQTISLSPYDSGFVEFTGIRISYAGLIEFTARVRVMGDEFTANDSLTVVSESYFHSSRGGPDEWGYRWIDSFDPLGGPSYTPVSIDGATRILVGDDTSTVVPLPFTFEFYGIRYDTIYVSTNGFASFQPITGSFFRNDTIPNSLEPNAVLAPFWDDMGIFPDRDTLSGVYTKYVSADRRFHIIWYNAFLPYSSMTDRVRFELILYDDMRILFNYETTETPATPAFNHGRSATVGIENHMGTIGLLYEYNGNPPSNLLFPHFAIGIFRVPESDTTPPVITHVPITRAYAISPVIIIYASIVDPSGIETDSLYYSTGGSFISVTHDSVVSGTYFYSIPMPSPGTRVSYYFVAYDSSRSRNRAQFPAGEPLGFYVIDPHYGVPDSAGYRFVDSFSDSALAPRFEWIELDPSMGGSGTIIPIFGDDILSAPIYIGGSFNFYGRLFDSVKVCTNGWLTFFTDEDTAWYRVSIPDVARPNATVVGWGVDLYAPSTTKIMYWSDPLTQRFIVEWKDVAYYAYRDSTVTFEIILEHGRSGSYITVQYLKTVDIPLRPPLIGIENLTGTDGVVYYAFGEPEGVGIPCDSLAVLFFNPTVGIEEERRAPVMLSFDGPVPNPFNMGCSFEVAIPCDGNIRVMAYNFLGQSVAEIFAGELKRGYHRIFWDATSKSKHNLPTGIYFIVLEYNDLKIVKNALLLK